MWQAHFGAKSAIFETFWKVHSHKKNLWSFFTGFALILLFIVWSQKRYYSFLIEGLIVKLQAFKNEDYENFYDFAKFS
jgi:hypothetical protein